MTDFDAFWAAYPRRVKRPLAEKAYAKARMRATAAEILAGVENYKRNKPDYADWAHPTSWLNAERWLDEYDEPAARPQFAACDHEPRCNSKAWCSVLRARERGEIA